MLRRRDAPAPRRRRHRHRGRAARDRRRDRVDPARRRQHPVDPGRPHRPVEPGRGGHGPRPRRPPRRVRAPRTTGWPASSAPTAAGTPTTSATTSRTRPSTPTSPATSPPACGTTTSSPATPPTCARLWPTVEAAIDFALDFQRETGEIAWRGDDPDDGALLTGSSSIHHSLKCALAIAERLGHERPDWELSLGSLAIAIAHRPDVFLDKDRWAMDWYYPILGGVLRGYSGRRARRVDAGPTFVVDGRGVRCVSDRPWVTAAETCELVMALDAIGSHDHARQLFGWVQFLRAPRRRLLDRRQLRRRGVPPRRRALPRRAADVELGRGRARRERARRHRAHRRAVPRRAPPRGPQRRRAARRRRRDRRGTRPRSSAPAPLLDPASQSARLFRRLDARVGCQGRAGRGGCRSSRPG